MRPPRLMVLGFARHGKDTVCDILRERYGLKFQSSSYFVAERAVRPHLEKLGITYPDFDAMYADRVNHRPDWFTAIDGYNKPDRTRLGRELFETYDIYCGIRNRPELLALKSERVVQFTIWVDASKRLPPEPESSITVLKEDADFVIDNNGTLEDLSRNVDAAFTAALFAMGKGYE